MKKHAVRFAVTAVILFSILSGPSASMMSRIPRPTFESSTPFTMPYPLTGTSVSIADAQIQMLPYNNSNENVEFTLRASFTLENTGTIAEELEIAVPFICRPQSERNIISVRLDDKIANTAIKTINQPFEIEAPEADWEAISISEYLSSLTSYNLPYDIKSFDETAPAALYRFTVNSSDSSDIGFQINFGYDATKTTLLINAPFELLPPITHSVGRWNGLSQLYEVLFDRPVPFEILVIGEDSLAYQITEQNMEPDDNLSMTVEKLINISPKEYIANNYAAAFFDSMDVPLADELGLYRRWLDDVVADCDMELLEIYGSEFFDDIPQSYANIQYINKSGYYSSSSKGHKSLQNSTAYTVKGQFAPKEEHVLTIEYKMTPGMIWNEEREQNLNYILFLTEPLKHWNNVGQLTVMFEKPENSDIIEYALPEGFIEKESGFEYISAGAFEENLFLSFWRPDTWSEPAAIEMFLFNIFLLAMYFWPVTLAIIIFIIWLVCRAHKRHRQKQHSGEARR